MRKISCAAAFGAIATAAFVMSGAPAQAATNVINTNCTGPITVYGLPGDTIVFNLGAGCQSDLSPDYEFYYFWNLNAADPDDATDSGFLDFVSMTNEGDSDTCDEYCGSTPEDWYTSTDDPSAVLTTTLLNTDGAGHTLAPGATLATLEVYYAEVYHAIMYGGAFAPADGTPIPDVVQQVGLPAGGSCATVDDKSLNWAGVTSGGWAQSWAQWANDGKGGGVCTRTLHYDNGWTVAA